jgi:xanthine/CO dehydrogenase XdhC/CoxF family maturation factor
MLEPIDKTQRTELISRESNGITVRLLWSRATNLVTVAVADAASDDYFELVLDEDEPALEVFNHPFAHAAARGLEFRTPRQEPEMLREAA